MLKILLADDHPLIRSGVRETLTRSGDYQVVAEAPDGSSMLALLEQHRPDLLVMDLQMPGPPAEELLVRAQEIQPGLKVLILSAHHDPKTLRRLAPCKLHGYILKEEAPEDLLQAVRLVAQGATWFSQSVAQSLLKLSQSEDSSLIKRLTERELSILRAMCQGKDNNTVARELSLSEQTVRNYTSTIYSKLGVHNRVSAVVVALQHDLFQAVSA